MDPFHRPGECDLTVNVDFAYLKDATTDLGTSIAYLFPAYLVSSVPCATAVTHHGPLSQAMFLHRMGLQARLDALKASSTNDERKQDLEQAAKRLTDPTGMGTQYQIMGMTGKRKGVLTDEERWPFMESA